MRVYYKKLLILLMGIFICTIFTNVLQTLADEQGIISVAMNVTENNSSGYMVTCIFTDADKVKSVVFPTWTESDDQDDIVWGYGTINGNVAQYRVQTSEHNNESGTYNTHIYAIDKNDNLIFLTAVTASVSAQLISASNLEITNKSASGYTVKCTFSGDVKNVIFPTWTESNGQDDIIWGYGNISGNTATYRVNTSDHNNESGTYNTHVYAQDMSGNLVLLTGTDVSVERNTSDTYSLTDIQIVGQTSNSYTIQCTFEGISAISGVVFPTWTELNGQDDIVWGEGNISGSTVTFTVLSNLHNNESGLYHTHIYVYENRLGGGQMVLVGGRDVTLTGAETDIFDNHINSGSNNSSASGNETISITSKTDWRAKWIWDGSDGSENNVWMNFRKTVNLDSVPSELIANIAVDSRYTLYINNQMVVFDGGLKRGPSPTTGYYDTVDIAPYLRAGNNTISVLVWYWGKDVSFSSTDSGHGGLLFEAISGGTQILSDSSWRVKRNTAYQNDTGNMQPNYRLPEYNVYYDARYELTGWQGSSYDDSGWANATQIGTGGCAPWNELYQRPIPLFKDYGLKDYTNSSDYVNYTTTADENITVDIPYNAQFTPYLKVNATAGKQIVITTENSSIGTPISTYVTKDGVQDFESLGWVNAEHVTYHIPAGVQIISLQYRESGYNAEFAGSFSCDDSFYNTLWKKSQRTLYVTMRDSFMDCPDRERAQWWADVTSEMNMLMYSMDSSSYLLYKKGLFSMLSYIDPNTKVLQTVVPISGDYFELPVQQLAGICGFETYYMYTGDLQLMTEAYEAAKSYVYVWDMRGDGLISYRPGSWEWLDWGDNIDRELLQNAWYYKALKSLRNMAGVLGKTGDISGYDQRLNSIYNAFQNYWTGEGYSSGSVPHSDNRVNAIAVLSGLADESKYLGILNNFMNYTDASPYMERYILDALSEMGYMAQAQSRIKLRYSDMVNADYSTLWEFWDRNAGTSNHAWSGGPLLTMSEYMAGVKPIEAGYNKYLVKPQLGSLTAINCTVPSVKGDINVVINKSDDTFNLILTSPASTTAKVAIPRNASTPTIYYNDSVVFQNGQYVGGVSGLSYDSIDSDYVYFNVNSSSSVICSFKANY